MAGATHAVNGRLILLSMRHVNAAAHWDVNVAFVPGDEHMYTAAANAPLESTLIDATMPGLNSYIEWPGKICRCSWLNRAIEWLVCSTSTTAGSHQTRLRLMRMG